MRFLWWDGGLVLTQLLATVPTRGARPRAHLAVPWAYLASWER